MKMVWLKPGPRKGKIVSVPDAQARAFEHLRVAKRYVSEPPTGPAYSRRDMRAAEPPITYPAFDPAAPTGRMDVRHHQLDEGSEAEEKPLARMTNRALHEVAAAEGIAVETDDNKADLVDKITRAREARA